MMDQLYWYLYRYLHRYLHTASTHPSIFPSKNLKNLRSRERFSPCQSLIRATRRNKYICGFERNTVEMMRPRGLARVLRPRTHPTSPATRSLAESDLESRPLERLLESIELERKIVSFVFDIPPVL